MKQILAIMAIILLMSAPVLAQDIDYCEGDFDCDGDCDGTDASVFKADFGRSDFGNPCPDCSPLIPIYATRQTNCYDELGTIIPCEGTGQDGELQLGYERYADNGDGTITDRFTTLMWLKDANCMKTHYPEFDDDGASPDDFGDGEIYWQHALDFVVGINNGTYPLCGAGYTDWRLANSNEGGSLGSPYPFTNLVANNYWSSTTFENQPDRAYCFRPGGAVNPYAKWDWYHGGVLPVRGQQTIDYWR